VTPADERRLTLLAHRLAELAQREDTSAVTSLLDACRPDQLRAVVAVLARLADPAVTIGRRAGRPRWADVELAAAHDAYVQAVNRGVQPGEIVMEGEQEWQARRIARECARLL